MHDAQAQRAPAPWASGHVGRVRTGGVDLDLDVTGDHGPAVVQLHGLTSSRRRERLMGLDVGAACTDARVLRYDARGHGRSAGSRDPRDYRWPRLAQDLLGVLDAVFPGEQVHGIGSSMGTATLLHAALADPGRFLGLSLLLPPTAWATRRAKSAEYLAAASLVETEGMAAFVDLGEAQVEPPAVRGRPRTEPDVPAGLLPTVLRGAAASDLPAPVDLSRIDVPVLLLAWTEDPSHPLSSAERLHAVLPSARLVVASTPQDVATWPGLVAAHVAASDSTT